MATLMGLSNELLLMVAAELQTLHIGSYISCDDSINWTPKSIVASFQQFLLTRDLFSLISTCRRLAVLLRPIAYKHISFKRYQGTLERFFGPTGAPTYLPMNRPLAATTETVIGLPRTGSRLLARLAELPQLKRVTLIDCDSGTLVFGIDGHLPPLLRATQIEARCCTLDLYVLVISARLLKELSFEWDDCSKRHSTHHPPSVERDCLLDTFTTQRRSLERLTMTRAQPEFLRDDAHYWWPLVCQLDLSAMTALKELRIVQAFLLGSLPVETDVHQFLPRGLQTLTVFWDNAHKSTGSFFDELMEDDGRWWVRSLAANKSKLPELRSVSLLSGEGRDFQPEDHTQAAGLIASLKADYALLEVDLRINLDLQWGEEYWDA